MEPTDSLNIREATLDAVSDWPRQRDWLPEHRADLLAAAWWAGNRNVAALARAADTARDTVYRDLGSRGIDPAGRQLPAASRPHHAWLMIAMERAMTEVACLLDPSASSSWGSREGAGANLSYLDSILCGALGSVHAHWAAVETSAELGARALDKAASQDLSALIGRMTMTVNLPNATSVTVTLDQVPQPEPDAGFTVVATDSPLLDTAIDGQDHLCIRSALEMIETVINRRMDAHAVFGD